MKKSKGYDLKALATILAKLMRAKAYRFHKPSTNSKLNGIYAFNLAPLFTCTSEACKHCGREGCYALKNMCCHGYDYDKNNCLKAWMDNTVNVRYHLDRLEDDLELWFNKRRRNPIKFFRIHSSGDFDGNIEYALMWMRIAKRHPSIKFLAFTKDWKVIRLLKGYKVPNLEIVLSGWTGMTIPEDLKEHYRCAYCVEDGCTPPEGAFHCPGNCDSCGMCWNLSELGIDTYFDKH